MLRRTRSHRASGPLRRTRFDRKNRARVQVFAALRTFGSRTEIGWGFYAERAFSYQGKCSAPIRGAADRTPGFAAGGPFRAHRGGEESVPKAVFFCRAAIGTGPHPSPTAPLSGSCKAVGARDEPAPSRRGAPGPRVEKAAPPDRSRRGNAAGSEAGRVGAADGSAKRHRTARPARFPTSLACYLAALICGE